MNIQNYANYSRILQYYVKREETRDLKHDECLKILRVLLKRRGILRMVEKLLQKVGKRKPYGRVASDDYTKFGRIKGNKVFLFLCGIKMFFVKDASRRINEGF